MSQLAPPHSQPTAEERGVADDVLRWLDVVRRGWVYIALSCLISLTVAALVLARSSTVYKGFARVLVLQQGGRPIRFSGGQDPERVGSEDYIPTHMAIIRSPLIVRDALKNAGAADPPLKLVLEKMTVTRPDPAAKILEISYPAATREQAVGTVAAVVASYRDFLKKNYQNSSNDVIALITKAREQLDAEIKDLERKYVEFHRDHPVLAATQDGRSLTVRRLDQLDSARNEAMLKEVRLKSQLDLGRKLAAEGKGLWAVAAALKTLGEGADVSGADPSADARPKTAEQIRIKILEIEDERAHAERMVASLRAEQAELGRKSPAPEDELVRAFRSDPEVAALLSQLKAATVKRDLALRTTRSRTDPSMVTAQRKVDDARREIDALYRARRPALLDALAKDGGDETALAVRKAEAELVVLRAHENVLRGRLDALDGGPPPAGADTAPRPGGHPGALLDSIENSLKAIETMREDMRRKFEDDLKASKDTEVDLLTEANLRSNLDRARAMFNSVVEQLKQAQLVSDYSSITAETLHEPDVTPLRPNWFLVLALALAAGCLVGSLGAFVSDTLDARIRTLSEIRKLLDLTVLGLIPHLPRGLDGVDDEVGLICMTAPRSMIAESYKSIRTNLEFHRRNRRLQVLLVTSPHSGDGKSTSASNLAISLAHAGRRVLLVDADLRRPSQHLLYGLSRERGLSNLLRRSLSAEAVTQPTPVPGLDFVSCGPEADNPAELLASPAFGEFLDDVRRSYDCVIIDSSPLLAVTDPCVIAAQVDGVILIVRANTIKRNEAEHTTDLLRSIGTPVVGAVVNGITRDDAGFGSGYGYGYGYGSGYGYGYDHTPGGPYGSRSIEDKSSVPNGRSKNGKADHSLAG